ncbi:MAG TPA: 3-methyl-2-oxobutanoate hydroxymethyltransferase [Tepidisphaeraceae bacterium]|nr:3-methyl-2-oxobutanoate hydroxymethyltransferase [Tepidisphaeraceae bacterium]
MSAPLKEKITLQHLRQTRKENKKLPILTCYDFTMARLMQESGVPAILVGDSASNVILGHDTTLPVSLDFMIDITAAVRRGAPLALLIADMPFGSYQASTEQALTNTFRMIKSTICDAVKIEATDEHAPLVRALSAAGAAIIAHLGLRPQSVNVLGGYRYQGKTALEAQKIVALSLLMEQSGAAAILLEAVPPEVTNAVIEMCSVPVIGCGAGPACHASVIVTHDGLGLTKNQPRFVPTLADVATPLREAFARYVSDVSSGKYPAPQHNYAMPPEEQTKLRAWLSVMNER